MTTPVTYQTAADAPVSAAAQPAWRRYRNTWVFLATFLLFLVHLLTSRHQQQYYDAAHYWRLATEFYRDGEFSIYHFNSTFRGYLFPLLYYPAAVIVRDFAPESGNLIIKIMGALCAATLFAVVCPGLWEKASKRPVGLLRRACFVVVCFVLWRDHFNFTLTDFPATLALFGALLAAYHVRKAWAALLSGALIAAAIYIRPICLAAAPLVLALLVQQLMSNGRLLHWKAALRVGFFALAFLLVAWPQYLINLRNYQSPSLFVLGRGDGNEFVVNGQDNLYLFKLNEGFNAQKYETNIGLDYAKAQIFYLDPAGRALFATNGGKMLGSYQEYFTFVLQHPLDMAALYTRHLFNALDVLYASPYVTKVYASTTALALFNYTVLFASFLVLVVRAGDVRPRHLLLIAAVLITCAASMPLMVECRYFVPMHMFFYAVACFGWPAQWQARQVNRGQLLSVGLAYVLFLVVCLSFSSHTQSMLELKAKTIQYTPPTW
ncbi:hypothetical protein [Hymenobacter sp. B81]|uniref:hypothetical protein n=1 Tax=Hymenobacter sp. B81 TaxID=3344878 RepID=UPI0037DC15FF